MMVRGFALTFALLLATAAVAQPQPAPPHRPQPQPGATPAEGIEVTVSDENDWQDTSHRHHRLSPPTATRRPSASAGSTGAGRPGGVADHRREPQEQRPVQAGRPRWPAAAAATAKCRRPTMPTWQGRSAEMLVQGYVRAERRRQPDDRLLSVRRRAEAAARGKAGWTVPPADWRRAAHKCSDLVYSRLSGENPFFDSRIAYIAETGPKNRRIKRLAIMDSDGANHRFLTSGQAIALTPRYSPDYRSILYLSYLNGKPRIYVYRSGDPETQRLITQNRNPTFAPRWSPDGRGSSIRWRSAAIPTSTGSPRRRRQPAADRQPGDRHRRQLFARRQRRSCSKATVRAASRST